METKTAPYRGGFYYNSDLLGFRPVSYLNDCQDNMKYQDNRF